jgi:5-formyltetrahydrofolate cyclo-ligase
MNPSNTGGVLEAAKSMLRSQAKARLEQMTADERAVASRLARELLTRQTRWQEARTILFFAPLPEELDVWPLLNEALAANKSVALPRYDKQTSQYLACEVRHPERDLRPGQFGILEPNGACPQFVLNRLDFILVPGLAFDLRGARLGRGKGYYDRLLPAVRGVTCGVAFEQQIFRELPAASHDIHVSCILTPTRWIEP